MVEIECYNCHIIFYRTTRHMKYCKKCTYERLLNRTNKYYHNNKKEMQKAHKEWKKNNRSKLRKYSRDKFKRDYAENPQKHIDKVTQYRKTEKGKIMLRKLSQIWNRKRRANKAKIIEVFTTKEWSDKLDNTWGICPGYKIVPHFVGKNKLELDHIYPIGLAKEGYVYTIDDIQPLCKKCNTKKGVKLQ